MVSDLTLIYYSANTIQDTPAQKIRDNLLRVTENKYPIVSVTQKPINFGKNICMGVLGRNKYNCYKQILIGAREAKTKYVACAEDDTLYSSDHFEYRPPKDTYSYDTNYWFAQVRKDFYWRDGRPNQMSGMLGCIVERETLIKTLSKRYEMYPIDPWAGDIKVAKPLLWGEPQLRDSSFGVTNKVVYVASKNPSVTFVHEAAMGYKQLLGFRRRYGNPLEKDIRYNLEGYGNIKDLWKEYWE